MAFLRTISGVRLCWELEEPQGPKGYINLGPGMATSILIRKEAGLFCGSFLRKGEVFPYVGLSHNLKDLQDQNLTDLCST